MKPTAALFLLFLLFLGLKLTGEIAWSWVWICAPLWIPAACGLLFGFFVTFPGAFKRAAAAKGSPAKMGGNTTQAKQPGQESAQSSEAVLHNGQRNLAEDTSRGAAPRATVSTVLKGRTYNHRPRRGSH